MANVRLTKIDLKYILTQVKVGTDYSKLFGALDPSGVREVSGANNNLVGAFDAQGNYIPGANPWGQTTTADTDFLRMTYTDTPVSDTGAAGTTYTPTYSYGDASPRLITNLISSSVTQQWLDAAHTIPNPMYNPAAAAARDANAGGAGDGTNAGGYDVAVGNSVFAPSGTTGAFIGDQGVLGGATFNEFFVAFGQFFDHGLDFISKGGSGFVAIPLSPNDPLYIDPSDPSYVPGASNVMYLTRAKLSNPDSDFYTAAESMTAVGNSSLAGHLKPGVTATYNNNTGFLVDQSQTYGSHASVNALLRQYDENGRPTGFLISSAEDGNVTTKTGTGSGATYTHNDLSLPANAALKAEAQHQMATWADFKFNALKLGLELTNPDSKDLPAILVDNTGKLMFDPSPVLDGLGNRVYYRSGETLAQMETRTGVALATLQAHDPFVRNGAGQVVHTNQNMFADMNAAADPNALSNEELDIHYVSGDGRTNENIGLTALHNIWHEEHNLETRNVLNSVLEEAANMQAAGASDAEVSAYINEWTRASGTTASTEADSFNYVDSNGAAHTLTGVAGINLDGGNVAWDGDMLFQAGRLITESEYNHVAINDYVRSLAVLLPEFVSYSTDVHPNVSLEFSQAIFRLGHSMLTEQLKIATVDVNGKHPGDEGYIETFGQVDLFDAFLNPAMYQDLGGSGIALGLLRQQANQIDEFVTPALQQTLVGAPLDLAALNIARGRDVGLPTLNELRQQVYTAQVAFNGANAGSALAPYTSWQDFGANLRTAESLVNFIAAYARDDASTGKDWGINEARDAYQAGTATLLDVRAAAQAVLDAYADPLNLDHDAAVGFMEGAPAYDEVSGTWGFGEGDMGYWDIDLWIGGLAEHPTFDGPLGTTFTYIMLDFGERMMDGDRFYYLYRMPVGQHLGDELLSHTFSEIIERTTGLDHIGAAFGTQTGRFILDGGAQNPGAPNPLDPTKSSVDANDNINDYFNASQHKLADGSPANLGHIIVAGLEGNDYIVGGFGDDYLYGDEGNDTIQGGQGNDNILGGDGDDWLYDDENDDTINGGKGNDHIFAGPGVLDVAHGAEGDDEVHGGDGIDEVYGDDGNDALFGEGDTDLMMGGEGDDYMNGGDGVDEMFGGNGNDWMQGNVGDDNINGGSGNDLLEGGLGATANDGDRLNGDSPVAFGTTIIEWNGDGTEGDMDIGSYEDVQFGITANLQTSNGNGTGSTLQDTYAFLEGLVGGTKNDTLTGADENTATSNGANNYLIGGGGDDTLEGLGGDDFIFGDSAIVDSALHNDLDTAHYGPGHAAYTGTTTQWGEVRSTYADGTKGHILGDAGAAGSADKVVFTGARSEYNVTKIAYVDPQGNSHNAFRIEDTVANRDGTDVVVDCELAQFSDGTYSLVPPTVSISDNSGNEGNAGTHNAGFTVSLDHNYILPVTVNYTTNNGTATTANLDYNANSGTVTIPAASTTAAASTATINVQVRGDTTFEANETFTVDLSAPTNGASLADAQGVGTIVNDDAMPTLSISNVSITEGNSGTQLMTFTVTQSAVSALNTSVNWATASGTATGGGTDFADGSGTLNIAAGSTSATFTVAIAGDVLPEANETFTVSLSGAVNATIATGTATGTIIDNDSLNLRMNPATPNIATLPGVGQFATMSATPGTTFTYQLLSSTGPSGGFTVSSTGAVSRTGVAMQAGETYVLDVEATDTIGGAVSNETITIKTGTSAGETLTAAAGDTIMYGGLGDDTLVSGAGDDSLLGMDGRDTASYATAGGAVTVSLNTTAVQNTGGAGNDTLIHMDNLIGSGFNDTLSGDNFANTIEGGAGDDAINGNGGNDTLIGGTGNDTFNGGGGNADVVLYTGSASDFAISALDGATLKLQDLGAGNQGTDTSAFAEILQFGSNQYTIGIDATGSNTMGNAAATTGLALFGRGGIDTLNGGTAADILNGGAGIDVINAGGGDDLIITFSTEGRDIIDGGLGTDTFSLIGDSSAEVFRIYSAAAWTALGFGHTLFNAGTGIVITRNGTTDLQVVAELRNVEEIKLLTSTGATSSGTLANGNSYAGGSGDTVQVIGNFVGTGLAYNTITVDGAGNTVDISQLTSDHRVVLNGDGSSIVGQNRPQDMVNGVGGAALVDPAATVQHSQDQIGGTSSVTAVAFNELAGSAAGGAAPAIDPLHNDLGGALQSYLSGQNWHAQWASETLIQPEQLTGPQLGMAAFNNSLPAFTQTFETLPVISQGIEAGGLGLGDGADFNFKLHRNFDLGINQAADELTIIDRDHHFLF